MYEHELGEVSHERLHLYMQVAGNLITVPVADKLDDVTVNTDIQERHGTCGVERMGREPLGLKCQVFSTGRDGGLEGLGDYSQNYISPPFCWRYDAGQGDGGGRLVIPQVEDVPNQGGFWTHEQATRELMAYLLSPYDILLGCECEFHECLGLKVRFCGSFRKDAMATSEGNVFETEWCAVRFGSSVLSWSEEEEVCGYNHVSLCLEDGIAQCIFHA